MHLILDTYNILYIPWNYPCILPTGNNYYNSPLKQLELFLELLKYNNYFIIISTGNENSTFSLHT